MEGPHRLTERLSDTGGVCGWRPFAAAVSVARVRVTVTRGKGRHCVVSVVWLLGVVGMVNSGTRAGAGARRRHRLGDRPWTARR